MSSNASTNSSGQTPAQELKDRLAEQLPAWGIPHLLGVKHLATMLHAARQRVNDSHNLQMQTLAKTTGNDLPKHVADGSSTDEMGDIIVKGDETRTETHNHYYNQPTGSAAGAAMKKAFPWLLATVLAGGAGAAIPLAWQWWNKQPAAPSVTLPDYSLDLKVSDKP